MENEMAPPGAAEPMEPEQFRKNGPSIVFTVIFGLILAGLLWQSISVLIDGIDIIRNPEGDTAQYNEAIAESLTGWMLWAEATFSFVLFAVIPAGWVALTRVEWRVGTPRYLFMTRPANWWKEIGIGAGIAAAMLVTLILFAYIQAAVTGTLDELFSTNSTDLPPLIQAFDRLMTWPLAIAIALAAGIGEEIFFRGVLQRWLGWWGQAIVFGLTHASYGTIDQIVIPFAIGLLFGYLVKRGSTLYKLMAAHFLFNFVQLASMAAT